MKKPDATLFSKKNDIHPFVDFKPLEFFANKNDASLAVFASHSKKRRDNLCFIRFFDYAVMDLFEMSVVDFIPMSIFEVLLIGFFFVCLIILER